MLDSRKFRDGHDLRRLRLHHIGVGRDQHRSDLDKRNGHGQRHNQPPAVCLPRFTGKIAYERGEPSAARG
jgi:hypothetical protein